MHDGLLDWIAALRGRLARGDLAGVGPIDLGDGTIHLPVETTIRVMLNDLDHLTALDGRARGNGHPPPDDALEDPTERRRDLMNDFRRLRELLG